MPDDVFARIIETSDGQTVRLPPEIHLQGDHVRIRRVGSGILLEPVATDVDEWFASMDRHGSVPFMEEGRDQPSMPPDRDVF